MVVRYRELYGTTLGDPSTVVKADMGRGVIMHFWGLPPTRRLPLRAYVAGYTSKNGVPINYIEAIGLCEWIEVGFNTFYTYRQGETAWIYAQALRCLRALTNASCISIYPYQIGQNNDEAIDSGAFWFYRKLGFRPGRADLRKLCEREEKKIAANPKYRTPPRTLKRLAEAHMFYDVPDEDGLAPGPDGEGFVSGHALKACRKRQQIKTGFSRYGPLGDFLHPQFRPANQSTHGERFQRRQPENPPSLNRDSNPSSKNQPHPLDPRSKAVPRKLVPGPRPNPEPTPLDARRKASTNKNHPRQKREHRNALPPPNPTPPPPPRSATPPGLELSICHSDPFAAAIKVGIRKRRSPETLIAEPPSQAEGKAEGWGFSSRTC